MASKSTQQYELLDRAANSQHDHSEGQAFDKQRPTKASRFSGSRAGFPARVAECIRPSKRTWIWMISSHITVTAILVATIVLGATKRTWAINEQASFLGINLSIDNQFFFFGVFNKAADYVLNDSIERISGVLLTVWMSGNTRFPGVLTLDFELPEEMAKPWRAILNAIERWKLDPPKNKPASLIRIVSSLASGFTVLLLGGSFNVVAIPKVRWTGNSAALGDTNVGERMERSIMQIDNIDWSHLDSSYNSLTDDGTFVGNTVAAMSTLDVLSDLVRTINEGSTWRGNNTSEKPGFVNLHTIQRGRPTQFSLVFLEPPLAVRGRGQTNANLSAEATLSTLSIQEGPIYEFWSGNTSSYGPKSFGARNWFNFTLPILSTKCINASNDTTQGVIVTAPLASSSTFEVRIPGSATNDPQSCHISVQQAIVPIYVYNSTQDARDEFNTPTSNPELYMTYLSSQEQNGAIASSLASKVNMTLPYFERVAGSSSTTVLTSLASTLIKQANSTYVNSPSVAMNYVIGSLAQHLITIASWEESDTGQRHLVGPIQWQLYGSGPRVPWEWAIACVLGIAVVILGYDLFLVFYRRIMPGPWLSVPGMMVAANSASSLRGPEDEDESAWRIGELTYDVERTKYCLGGGHDGPPELTRLDVRQRKVFGERNTVDISS